MQIKVQYSKLTQSIEDAMRLIRFASCLVLLNFLFDILVSDAKFCPNVILKSSSSSLSLKPYSVYLEN